MESSILLRKTISSSPHAGHGWEKRFAGAFFLWGKRLLPRRIPGLAIVPRGLSDDKETGVHGRPCPALRLLLGGHAANETRRDPGFNALSSPRTDEKAESDFWFPSEIQEGRQLYGRQRALKRAEDLYQRTKGRCQPSSPRLLRKFFGEQSNRPRRTEDRGGHLRKRTLSI